MRCRFRFVFVGLFVLYALSCFVVPAGAQSVTSSPADAPPAPQIQQTGPHNTITIRAAGLPGHYSGFDVLADDQIVAPVRFTSHDLIACAKPVATENGLTSALVFDDLQADAGCGLALEHSRIVVTLRSGQYPAVTFDLHIAGFDARQWQNALGMQPFHFLTLGMPDATVWHQEGWLFATPRADLFPLLLDIHQGAPTLAAAYNHEWSRTPPLSAHPLPVIGLWSPAHKLYAAWDFQAARLEDHSERDIATGFCNRLVVSLDPVVVQTQETVPPSEPVLDWDAPQSRGGQPPRKRDPRTRKALSYAQETSREFDRRGVSKFVALVYPSGSAGRRASQKADDQRGSQNANLNSLQANHPSLHSSDCRQLAYPGPNTRIASHADLVFSADLSDTDDPNRLLWQNWWNTPAIRARLSRVPRVNDLAWIPPAQHLTHLPAAPQGSLLTSAAGDFQMPGSLLLSGAGWHNEGGVDAPAQQGDKARLAQLQSDAHILLKYVRRFWDSKEPCAYWEQPLAGEYTPYWGGEPATTLHNAEGWTAARLLLDLYRMQRVAEEEKKRRGEQKPADSVLPLPPPPLFLLSLIDGAFNWTKHSVWTRGSVMDRPAVPAARNGALAAAFLLDYYFTFKDDLTDGAHRTRALQARDMARAFAYRYLILWTGDNAAPDDPHGAFEWQAVAGAAAGADRKDASDLADAAASLDTLAQVAAHTGDPILLWALQGSMVRNQANRQMAATFDMLDPIGDANVRVICGEQAALAFGRNARDIVVTDYHCTRPGDFAFTLRRLGSVGLQRGKDAPVKVVITFPYADLSHKAVAIRRGNILQRTLKPGIEVTREPDALWSLVVDSLHNGDTVLVGSPDLNAAETLPSAPPLVDQNK